MYGQAIHEVDLVDYGLVQSDTHMYDKCCSEKADVVSVWSVSPRTSRGLG